MSADYDIASPGAAELFESLRAFGYDLPTALADIIDNSISAEARNIWIDMQWDGQDSRVLIRDDGKGMTEDALRQAMKPGSLSPLADRAVNDLGRFGLGMKTASISQCRCLTVLSKTKASAPALRRWDLDYIANTGTGEWRLLKKMDLLSAADHALLAPQKSGTILFWDRLDTLVGNAGSDEEVAQKHFRERADAVKHHLSMVFHRFLKGRGSIKIHMNGREIEPWDPFLEDVDFTDPQSAELLVADGEKVEVKPFILPHHSRITADQHQAAAGPKGWNAHQGFYIYRNRRLLVAGDWLGLGMQKEEHFKLARIRIDLANSADPIILVVKKRVSILENLIAWVQSVRAVDDPATPGGKIVRDVPILVIDDEADNASANTNEFRNDDGTIDEDADPTKTNLLIRRLLVSFEKSAYVGYTATPFANVFIHHEAKHKIGGPDLFPRSFIINLPAPSNYIGPEKVFGINRPGADGEAKGLPIIRRITDAAAIFPPSHKMDLPVTDLPDSLKEAMLAFILVCAARRVRGDVNVDNSMLVHVTRLVAVQDKVASLVDDHLVDVVRQLEFPGTGGTALTDLQALWRKEFAAKSAILQAALSDHDLPPANWKDVKKQLFDAATRIRVRRVNGSAKDALDYSDHPGGLSVIAIGGDKLSRGLTLEGLSISYFIRTSKMYDTLMQMGRWFGYRPRYADLCRLYTSPTLVRWYRHIATATAELREEFDLAFNTGQTPLQFGHRVRTHPDGLLITAANKMRAGSRVRAGFSGTISETVSFEQAQAQSNFNAFSDFLDRLPKQDGQGRQQWDDVDGSDVVTLLRQIETSRDSWKANARALAEYVSNRVTAGRLGKWTVVLAGNGRSKVSRKVGPYTVTLTDREPDKQDGKITIGRLVSPADESVDLDRAAQTRAMEQTVAAWEKKPEPKRDRPQTASGPFIRRQRSPNRGLLIIYPIDAGLPDDLPLMGFAVSFPFDDDAPLVDYAENSVKQLESLFE